MRMTGLIVASLLILSSASYAAHSRHLPNPSPSPATAEAAPAATTFWGITPILLGVILLMAGGIVYLYRQNLKLRNAFKARLQDLKDRIQHGEHSYSRLRDQLSESKSYLEQEQNARNQAELGLEDARRKLRTLEKSLAEIRDFDSEIDKKVKALAEERAKAKAQEDERRAQLVEAKRLQKEGQEKLNSLLADMKRGY